MKRQMIMQVDVEIDEKGDMGDAIIIFTNHEDHTKTNERRFESVGAAFDDILGNLLRSHLEVAMEARGMSGAGQVGHA